MNDYTHAGSLHIERWNRSDDSIEPGFNKDEIEATLQSTEVIGAHATLAIATLSNESSITDEVLAVINQRWPSLE